MSAEPAFNDGPDDDQESFAGKLMPEGPTVDGDAVGFRSAEQREHEEDCALLRASRVAAARLLKRWAQRYALELRESPVTGGGTPSWEPGRYIARRFADQMQQSEMVTTAQLNTAVFADRSLPAVWAVFLEGLICLSRLRKIVTAAEALHSVALLNEFDRFAAAKTPELAAGKLTNWLNQTIASLNADDGEAQYTQAIASRRVVIEHRADGMSEISAVVPTLEALQIQTALREAARGLDHPVPFALGTEPALRQNSDEALRLPLNQTLTQPLTRRNGDPRTVQQREADAFTAWLRFGSFHRADSATRAPALGAKIAVLVPETTLIGEDDRPAITADRRAALPAAQIRHYLRTAVQHGSAIDWYTAFHAETPRGHRFSANAAPLPEPQCPTGIQPGGPDSTSWQHNVHSENPLVPKNLLAVVYEGHDPPQRLRDAVIFRDGTCQEKNCTVPAENCDLDHQVPWQPEAHLQLPGAGGPTTAGNLWTLCRRHHRQKSHGFLTPPEPHAPGPDNSAHNPWWGAGAPWPPPQADANPGGDPNAQVEFQSGNEDIPF